MKEGIYSNTNQGVMITPWSLFLKDTEDFRYTIHPIVRKIGD